MKGSTKVALLIFIISIFGCARISSPKGGPEDKTPPTLIKSIPEDSQINYNGNTVILEFDEWIKTNNIESNLIITPSIEGGFKSKVNKQSLILTFLQPLADSTTYTFNFLNTVQDITNNNIPPNLKLSFSTGPYLDSLEIKGRVLDLYTQKPKVNTLVSLYRVSDTLDVTTGPASYFTRTDTAGNYTLSNLPSENYFLYAAIDKNNNLKAETDEEPYGFYADTIKLDTRVNSINFTTQRLNIKPLTINSTRPFGKYFNITFSKAITSYSLHHFDNSLPTHSQIDDQTIRLYNTEKIYGDTTKLILTATDSINSNLIDTISYYFIESKIKGEVFTFQLFPTESEFNSNSNISLVFTKPVKQIIYDSLYYQIDSIKTVVIPDSLFYWNDNQTKLEFPSNLDFFIKEGEHLDLMIKPGAFISIENDSTLNRQKRIKSMVLSESGVISGRVNTDAPYYILQLLTSDLKVIQQKINEPNFTFNYLTPGNYLLRLIIDSNQNSTWDTGNLLTRTPPEVVTFYYDSFKKTNTITLRKNWELNDITLNFNVNN